MPLGPHVVQLDYLAIMGSRQRLRRELDWRGWPRNDFTLEDNEADLAEHFAEFQRGEAYAYSVLNPDESTCLGCIYLEPWTPGAQLALWVVDAEVPMGLELHLLRTLVPWLAGWPLPAVRVPVRASNPRLQAVLRDLECPAVDGPPDHQSFLLLRRGS